MTGDILVRGEKYFTNFVEGLISTTYGQHLGYHLSYIKRAYHHTLEITYCSIGFLH